MNSSLEAHVPVYVVDDNQEIRDSIEWTLNSVGYEVRTFDSARDCLAAIDGTSTACIVVDLLMPGMTGLQLCQELRSRHANCAVLMISAHGDVSSAVAAMKLGALDFLVKPFGREHLLQAVNRCIAHAATLQGQSEEEERVAELFANLSLRERQVLECMADGMVSKQIAIKLRISPRTVDVHRSNIAQKLQIDSPSQLLHLLLLHHRRENRLQQPPPDQTH